MSYISANIDFKYGENRVRQLFDAHQIKQYLPFHFTLLYGCEPFVPEMKEMMEQFSNPSHPIYTDKPKPIGIKVFHNEQDGYRAVAIIYEWQAGKDVNMQLSSNPAIFPKGSNSGFNGDKWTAHVTIAYIDKYMKDNWVLDKNMLNLFECEVKNVSLMAKVKPSK